MATRKKKTTAGFVDVTPLEESDAFAALLAAGREVADIAARIGRPERYVRDRLRLQDLLEDFVPALERTDNGCDDCVEGHTTPPETWEEGVCGACRNASFDDEEGAA